MELFANLMFGPAVPTVIRPESAPFRPGKPSQDWNLWKLEPEPEPEPEEENEDPPPPPYCG